MKPGDDSGLLADIVSACECEPGKAPPGIGSFTGLHDHGHPSDYPFQAGLRYEGSNETLEFPAAVCSAVTARLPGPPKGAW